MKARIGWQGLTTKEYLESGEYILITGTDFSNGKINWSGCFFVEKKRYLQDTNIQIRSGDILITKDGTIGKIAYIEDVPLPTTLNSGVFVVRKINDKYFSKYLYYVFTSNFFISFLNKLKAGSTINHLYQKDFVTFNLLLPSIKEQKRIARMLSDVDTLINELNVLINKKELLKKGLMQELLTGKKRLSGYENTKWRREKLGKFIYLQGGFAFKSNNFQKKGTPIIRISDIDSGTINLEDVVYYPLNFHLSKDFIINKNDSLIAMSGATTGKVGIYNSDSIAYQNQRVGKFVLKDKNMDKKYIHKIISSDLFKRNLFKELEQGAQPNISAKQIEGLIFDFSMDRREQEEIANILFSVDGEINDLVSKRNKYELIKKGLMQELLTGRLRVKL